MNGAQKICWIILGYIVLAIIMAFVEPIVTVLMITVPFLAMIVIVILYMIIGTYEMLGECNE